PTVPVLDPISEALGDRRTRPVAPLGEASSVWTDIYAGPDTLEKERRFRSGSLAVRVCSIVWPAPPLIGDGWSRIGALLGVTVMSSVAGEVEDPSLAAIPPVAVPTSSKEGARCTFPVA